MGEKLGKREFPSGHGPDDFECFGPPATKDGEFAGTRICDMGCFKQGETDSNKYYHASIVKSKKNGEWFAYFEWGRVGNASPDCQFVSCVDEQDAQEEYESQLHSKNDKRGQWTTIAGIKTLEAKPGKDCYLVRPQQTRATGLPDGKKIQATSIAKAPAAKTPVKAGKSTAIAKPKADPQTIQLMRDLNVATVQYTKGAMADASLPTQTAIDEGRQVLTEAQKRLKTVGDNVDDQVADKELNQLTGVLYSRIPKKKALGAPAIDWILSKNNISMWQQDLDAFEAALYSTSNAVAQEADPFDGMALDMHWLDPKSSIGAWVHKWAPRATRNRHGGIGDMKIHNAWAVARHGDEKSLFACQDAVASARSRHWAEERALHQPDVYPHVSKDRKDAYEKSHTAVLFHGTRSVNVSGILRKALLMPKQLVGVVITGAMFGPGLYFADDWKKSAGYTSLSGGYYSSGGGSVRGRHAFMFMADVVLGNPHVASGPHGYTSPPKGCHSVFGKANHSQVMNNEWIIFQAQQNMLRFLFEFSA